MVHHHAGTDHSCRRFAGSTPVKARIGERVYPMVLQRISKFQTKMSYIERFTPIVVASNVSGAPWSLNGPFVSPFRGINSNQGPHRGASPSHRSVIILQVSNKNVLYWTFYADRSSEQCLWCTMKLERTICVAVSRDQLRSRPVLGSMFAPYNWKEVPWNKNQSPIPSH